MDYNFWSTSRIAIIFCSAYFPRSGVCYRYLFYGCLMPRKFSKAIWSWKNMLNFGIFISLERPNIDFERVWNPKKHHLLEFAAIFFDWNVVRPSRLLILHSYGLEASPEHIQCMLESCRKIFDGPQRLLSGLQKLSFYWISFEKMKKIALNGYETKKNTICLRLQQYFSIEAPWGHPVCFVT